MFHPVRRTLLTVALLGAAACGPDGPAELTAPTAGPATLEALTVLPIPPDYGVHDTFVRDGLAFVSAWNAGLMIYDVGNGIRGGTPEAPVLVSEIVTAAGSVGGARVHNAWWFHDPSTGARRYVFVGQEGPGAVGVSASGDLHVVDVSDLARPVEVASYHLDRAGAHNFWMDEDAAVLYAAFYNGGVVALDVSGTLSGDLSDRVIARYLPGGPDTYVWGVMLHAGDLYAIDMLDGLYRITADGVTSPAPALGMVTEHFSSDLWLHGGWGYTATWGNREAPGNAVYVWRLETAGPTLAARYTIPDVGTLGDLEVSADGTLLVVAAERGPAAGVHLLEVTRPDAPRTIARALLPQGVHTATFGYVGGRTLIFAARNPANPAVVIYDVSGLP